MHWAFYGEDEVQDGNAIGDKKNTRQKPMGIFRSNRVSLSKSHYRITYSSTEA
jgi:hypothetical protein